MTADNEQVTSTDVPRTPLGSCAEVPTAQAESSRERAQ